MGFDSLFLTGTSGILGARVLLELLRFDKKRLFCLMRGSDPHQEKARLAKLLQIYDPSMSFQRQFEDSVTVVLGDVSKPQLAMSKSDYKLVTEETNMFLHMASLTNLFAKADVAQSINVSGVQNIIDACLKTKQKRLCYVSTYTVMGDKYFDPQFEFQEDQFDIGQGFSFMPYQRSKFFAERLIRSQRELNWSIIRPGQIFGDSETGHYPYFSGAVSGIFYDLIRTAVETGLAANCHWRFDITPVDYCAKALLFLAQSCESAGQTFHLTHPKQLTYNDVIDSLRACGAPIKTIEYADYKELILNKKLQRQGRAYQSPSTKALWYWFKKAGFDFSHTAKTSSVWTQKQLQGSNIECHPFNKELMSLYLIDCIKSDYIKRRSINDEMVRMG